ncbi:4-hydroxyphenylpyruvate dioxygenase [Rhodococcus aetherivorans]|jgi:sugar phosphate isomerase/epimerase|uniref:4-hydroxyphenylpyruvate dioxygenase n=1 Tax=Rhodococcus aetherivorans TaxID=191292 RepID=A0ABQ0YTM0_9NOCA|nr:sugar phosphate isomerase/epimerase [Rhodococcus aetherivorans]ETT25559.1 Xylose isomerase domain-containing protein TIM barrel [Rhodococcus rhodochrous ATCC 21198]MDV6296492.1 sugar phosphate isomerase/epimerase [Rhodococcus aetherivorans]GES39925.1 4-hydroxyphenylpyruvate dioxygenase [Rhodococcus aetherivorans]
MNQETKEPMKPQLIATCWTSAGDAAPMRPDESSPVPLAERIALIAQTGWSGIGLVHADLLKARDTIGYPELSRMIREAGLEHVEVEFLNDWWTTGDERVAADRLRADLFEAAVALGARHIKVGAGMTYQRLPLSTMASAFADLADEAAESGIQLALEATPFSHLRTTQEAVEVVTRSDSPSAGLMIDIWHTAKTGLTHEQLWDFVPIERVAAVEIDDGYFETLGTIFEDTINRRTYCGEGDFDTADFVRRTLEAGYQGPWGVEIISAEHRSRPVADGLKRAYDTAMSCFADVHQTA